ncbi:hypothetical protein BDV59DRAFT_195334 [Aspergillus ambiguus]|uniref:S8 family peptidase n=1 Tax=Aspergillus ambiguus TaxID=176160 RepID=UPI003CCDDD91
MDEDQLWLSEEDSEDDRLDDPTLFTMALTYQGPPGEFRTRNRPGERQRPHVSVYQAGPRKKPAFTVSCNAKAMIHGKLRADSSKMATLLVYEFRFRSYKGARLKEADISFEFEPRPRGTGRISVAKVRPDGVHKMEKIEQAEGKDIQAGVSVGVMQTAGLEVGVGHSVEKVAKYHTVITGDRPQDEWGDFYKARWSLTENKAQADGIPSELTTCVLLERDDDQDFVCVPIISVKANFLTTVATLFSARDPDDPVYFSVDEPPFDLLEGRVKIDRDSLGATDLDQLWDCTMYNDYQGWIEVVELLEKGEVHWENMDNKDKLSLAYHDANNTARPTFLHKLAQEWGNDVFRNLSMETRENIALFLLDKERRHAHKRDDPILSVAIGYHTTDFIEFIIANRPKMLRGLLMDTDVKGMNCLHKAFKDTLLLDWKNFEKKDKLISTMSRIMSLLEHADVASIIAKDNFGNTPIHYAMDYRLCHISTEYKHYGRDYTYEGIIRALFSLLTQEKSAMRNMELLFNNKRIDHKTRQMTALEVLEKDLKPTRKETMKEDYRDSSKGAKRRTLRGPASRTFTGMNEDSLKAALPIRFAATPSGPLRPQSPSRGTGPPMAPMATEKDHYLKMTKLESLVRIPTRTSDTKQDDVQLKAVPEAEKSTTTGNPEVSKPTGIVYPSEEEKQVAERILGFLKSFFIRNYTNRDAKDLLYGKRASDKNLFFDASHLRGRSVSEVVQLIDKIYRAGGFEDTLSYVRIPFLVSEAPRSPQIQRPNIANEKRQLKKGPISREPKGRDTLVEVFKALVKVKVRRILRLQVEDNADDWSHTDTAIEQAIKGYDQYSNATDRPALEIEEWDWCKPDINLDHIHLHWSGNQSVLYGWASNENGIPLICRNNNSLLSKITLHAYQVCLLPFVKPRSDAWLEAMHRFRGALSGMHHSGLLTEPQRVKVALIDDGIDLHEFNAYNDAATYTGLSYCSGSECDADAWWKSTGGHGTIMANMISRINPWVHLEVIKIQSGPAFSHGDGARSISPSSAADAINAAVTREADIISMSWTITNLGFRMALASNNISNEEDNQKYADQSDLNLLREAITNAVKNDIRLLICAAADDVRLNGDNTLPYSQAPAQILRIGAAGPLANRDPGSGSGDSITYYLPGNQVAEDQKPHSAKPVVYHNGSSVSTALAAGLASLITYCAHCLHSCGAGDEYQGWALALRNHTNMRKAFNSINRYCGWKDDDKIVAVWDLFGDKGSRLEKANDNHEKIRVLKEMVTYLCQDVR